jgi:hypothetical protein
MDGQVGGDVTVPLALANTGSGLLGEARRRVVLEMLAELTNGLIDPGYVQD